MGNLGAFMAPLDVSPVVVAGYEENPLDHDPHRILLTGVPLSATYSLSDPETQALVDQAFGWLRRCPQPVMGICYGHQILAHVFGGQVSTLGKTVLDERCPLALPPDKRQGILTDVEHLRVFAKHRDYVSVVPEGFTVLCAKNDVPYIVYHPGKTFYGFQFVPELSDAATKDVLKRFLISPST